MDDRPLSLSLSLLVFTRRRALSRIYTVTLDDEDPLPPPARSSISTGRVKRVERREDRSYELPNCTELRNCTRACRADVYSRQIGARSAR